jgi:hypothetical protein
MCFKTLARAKAYMSCVIYLGDFLKIYKVEGYNKIETKTICPGYREECLNKFYDKDPYVFDLLPAYGTIFFDSVKVLKEIKWEDCK